MGSYYLYNLWAKLWNARNDQECRAKGLPTFDEWLEKETPWEDVLGEFEIFRPFTITATPDGEFHKTYTDQNDNQRGNYNGRNQTGS